MRVLSSPIVACFLVLSLAGCAETSTCPEGTARRIGADGRPEGDCIPVTLEDAGQDAQVAPDAEADAGPCGVCPDGEVCDVDSTDCVQCVGPSDCDSTAPVCNLTTHTCVGCVLDSDCNTAAAARCNAGTCVACDNRDQCAGITGTEECGPAGECVACTATETAECGGNPCTLDNTCSAYGTGREVCEACDTDANCQANHFCMPMEYDSMTRPGGYCLLDLSLGGGCTAPFTTSRRRTSLSGRDTTFCGINEPLATCEATRALIDSVGCPTGGDSECPQPSGLCRTISGVANRCTYACGAPGQCLNPTLRAAESTCGVGGGSGPMFCGG
jgi:hypothetical protein